MNPTLAVIAERVERRSDGGLNVLGIHGRREVPAFPAQVELVIALEFAVTDQDRGPNNVLSVHVLQPDGHEYVKISSSPIDLTPRKEDDYRPAGSFESSLPLKVTFPGPGRYTLDIRHNGVSWVRLPYIVAELKRA